MEHADRSVAGATSPITAPFRHLAFRVGDVVMVREGDRLRPPEADEVAALENALGMSGAHRGGALGHVDVTLPFVDTPTVRLLDLDPSWDPQPPFEAVDLRALSAQVDGPVFRRIGAALQKLEWLRTHAFCSRCGTPTHRDPEHESMTCAACGQLHFPRQSPAVIVLVERGREMLLARSPRFPDGMYSTLAGFVEPGESLEEAVHREVHEEVGVRLEGLRYFGSQPWPFPHSLMVGFVARWASGDLRPDGREIEDAAWFTPERLPPRLPTAASIARKLVDDFLSRMSRAPDDTGRTA